MMAVMPERKSTVMSELIMENQWICCADEVIWQEMCRTMTDETRKQREREREREKREGSGVGKR